MVHETPLDVLEAACLNTAQDWLEHYISVCFPNLRVQVRPQHARGMSDYVRLGLPRFRVHLVGSTHDQRTACLEILQTTRCGCNGSTHVFVDHLEGGRGTSLDPKVYG